MSRYIDADALIRRWCGIKCGCERDECGREIEPCIVVMAIEEAPTIDRPQGKWIDAEIRHEDGVLPIQVCSECKTFYPLEYTGGGHRFCPSCGARMKGADDE